MSTPLLSRKEREKRAHQQDILSAARELFLLKGYHETTLEEIARHAEFGKGTIYNYFSSKEELFHAIRDQLIGELEALAHTAIAECQGDCRQMLHSYARQVIRHARDNSDLISLVMHKVHQLKPEECSLQMNQFAAVMQKIWKIIVQPLQAAQADRNIKPFDPMALAILFDGMIRIYCFNRFGPQRAFDEQEIDEAAEMIVSIFFDGINHHK